ncbi:related to aminotriazole resistance protein [Ramularia collo-cygni]|uniref:Related to aminotriazole resistance protein n=1 Tax=Ramularia collo-cygni TaxID=112498 RepID=A0A2D3V9G8_9PEZI|nr:related to aminotriazole resistance protein [Ramularia collo-cygni]CZT21407.1 related to aminotriazole resistance protein [Ramularia collo-cygni]
MAFALFGSCAPGGALIGYAFAAMFAELAWWPWAFFSFGIALFCIALAAQLAIPDPQDEKPGLKGKDLMGAIWELDLLGAVIGITALILFNFAWNQAPLGGVGWSSPYIIVCLILGLLLAPLFFWIETRVARNPLLPLEVFTSSNGFVLACVACGWASFGIWVFYIWQILTEIRGASPLLVTAYLSPLALSGIVAAVSTGALLHKMKPAWIMIIALCAFMTSSTLTATLPPHQTYWAQIFVCTLIAPFGMDMSFPSATLVISDSVAKRHQGVAASLVNTVVNYSISMGLGFAGTVEVHVNRGGTTLDNQLLGFRGALYLGIGLAALGVLIAIIFLAKSYLNDHRERKRSEKQTSADIDA